jgi:hypothetical protein
MKRKKNTLFKSEDHPVLSSWLLVIITIGSDTLKRFQDSRRHRNGTVYQNLEICLFVKMYLVEPGGKYGNSVRRKSVANPFSFLTLFVQEFFQIIKAPHFDVLIL